MGGSPSARTAAEKKLVEQRATSVVEHHEFAIEDVALGQEVQHPLEPLHAVAVA
jgi:hypothetical protein